MVDCDSSCMIILIQQMNHWSTSNSAYGSSYTRSSLLSSPQKRTLRLNSPSRNRSSPLGLSNLGNTCYISAVMQVLFQIISEADFAISKKTQQLTSQFFALKKSRDRDDYRQFKSMLEDRIEIVRGWEQQDAHELFIQFIEQLRQENSQKLAPGQIDLSYRQNKTPDQNWRLFVKQMEKLQRSKVISIFYGETLKQYTCPYGHSKRSFERYSNLSLPFSPKSSTSKYYFSSEGPLSLKDMLQEYLGEEQIDDVLCQKCKKKMRFRKKASLYTLPKYLILHLSRFIKGYYDSEKNYRQVTYDQFIRLDEGASGRSVQYQLMGVIHHHGTLNRGHYYAEVRLQDEWYEFDDERVTSSRVRKYDNVSKSAYMLVYQRV